MTDDPRTALSTIPFCRETFLEIMRCFHLPKTLLRMIFKGEAHFSGILDGVGIENVGWKGEANSLKSCLGYLILEH